MSLMLKRQFLHPNLYPGTRKCCMSFGLRMFIENSAPGLHENRIEPDSAVEPNKTVEYSPQRLPTNKD